LTTLTEVILGVPVSGGFGEFEGLLTREQPSCIETTTARIGITRQVILFILVLHLLSCSSR
jgi:hypothetical protein